MSVSLLKKSPPAPDQRLLSELNDLGSRLDQQQLWWASGYLAGLAASAGPTAAMPLPATAADASPQHAWTVLYGTETGNCRAIAAELVEAIRGMGAEAEAVDLSAFRPALLRKQARVLFVVATHGLGEPPDGTEEFFEFLLSDRAPRLEDLGYSVLALGDSSYDDFCATGRELDARLEALGARRLEPRVDCDVDFETATESWKQQVLARIREEREAADVQPGSAMARLVPVSTASYSRKNPFMAPVLGLQRITGAGSSKDVRHVVLGLEGSGLVYEPGDALGVWPINPPRLVEQFLSLTSLDAATPVEVDGDAVTLGEALAHRLELTLLGRGFIEDYAARYAIAPLQTLLDAADRSGLNDYLGERQIIDVLREHPVPVTAQQLVDVLKRLTPRLYSIASSLEANPDEVHVTIAVVEYTAFGEQHLGSASNYLAEPGDAVPVYIAPNPRFRLPQDAAAPVIMIGAGTGVAPFRAFLEQREASGASGDNWLFFGDRNFSCDFLYQVEWARLRQSGLLGRHHVAFSRDQAEKVYVQDRIREQADELFQWLERGAHVYVCGDAKHMAPDVHEALLHAIARGLGCDAEGAEAYLRDLKKTNRYQRDVY
ncbi:MAG: assimilatory sulfite reductase (NADPH) flavoprotein subunit [Pseudomonadales bacterium]